MIERHRVADLAQQLELEEAQRDILARLAQSAQHVEVVLEQALVRIGAREQPHDQFVGIERRQQCIAAQRGQAADPLDAHQVLDFVATAP